MNRRTLLATGAAAAAGASRFFTPAVAFRSFAFAQATPVANLDAGVSLHTYAAGPAGFFVNAYLVETPNGIVVIDGTLTVTDATALREQADEIGKPLLGVLLTHGHPDHYAGVATLLAGTSVPIVATTATDAIIRRDDAEKDANTRLLLGDEWPTDRIFPNTTLDDGESVELDGVVFTVRDLGPGESHADGRWTVSGLPDIVFIGDTVYSRLHSFLADGHTGAWLDLLASLKPMLGDAVTLFPGHGGATTPAVLDWQVAYISKVREAVCAAAGGAAQLTDATRAEARTAILERYPEPRLTAFLDFSLDAVSAELAGEA